MCIWHLIFTSCSLYTHPEQYVFICHLLLLSSKLKWKEKVYAVHYLLQVQLRGYVLSSWRWCSVHLSPAIFEILAHHQFLTCALTLQAIHLPPFLTFHIKPGSLLSPIIFGILTCRYFLKYILLTLWAMYFLPFWQVTSRQGECMHEARWCQNIKR